MRGLLPALKNWDKRPPILCEIGWGAKGHPAWEAELAVFAELIALGYRATTLEGEPVVLEEVDKTCDVLSSQSRTAHPAALDHLIYGLPSGTRADYVLANASHRPRAPNRTGRTER